MGVENYYHVFTKSIARYKIFVKERDFRRMQEIIWYYRYERKRRFSQVIDFIKENYGDKIVK
ncbi:MAG: hypothetical protein ACK4F0_05490, partial [Candidatus Ratteibacteria bacterium]